MEHTTESKEFTPEASLRVIYEMIESTRSKIGKNYFYFLFWGYLICATCIAEYILISANYARHYLVWPVLMMAGTLVTLLFYFRIRRTSESRSFIGTAMSYFWFGWFVAFMLQLAFLMIRKDFIMILPMAMAMYGLAIFVSGGLINFRPLILGAMIAWIASLFSFFEGYQVQLIILAGMVIIAYIIPGHLLKVKSKA